LDFTVTAFFAGAFRADALAGFDRAALALALAFGLAARLVVVVRLLVFFATGKLQSGLRLSPDVPLAATRDPSQRPEWAGDYTATTSGLKP
jgi:hypothetical protein